MRTLCISLASIVLLSSNALAQLREDSGEGFPRRLPPVVIVPVQPLPAIPEGSGRSQQLSPQPADDEATLSDFAVGNAQPILAPEVIQRLDPADRERVEVLSTMSAPDPAMRSVADVPELRLGLQQLGSLNENQTARAAYLESVASATEAALSVEGDTIVGATDFPLAVSELSMYFGLGHAARPTVEEYKKFVLQRFDGRPELIVGEPTNRLGIPQAIPFYIIDNPDIYPVRELPRGPLAPGFLADEFRPCGEAGGGACPDERHGERISAYVAATGLLTDSSQLESENAAHYSLQLPTGEYCSARPRAHCSGVLDSTRNRFWTAAHCLTNLPGLDAPPPAMGQTSTCSSSARIVFGLADRAAQSDAIPAQAVFQCKSVTRQAEDIVSLELDRSVPESLAPHVPEVLIPANPEVDIYAQGTSLVGFGFTHTTQLVVIPRGEIRPAENCTKTFKSKFGDSWTPQSASTLSGPYLCISSDSLSGASGGPLYALLPDGRVVLAALYSFAYTAVFEDECRGTFASTDPVLNVAARIYRGDSGREGTP